MSGRVRLLPGKRDAFEPTDIPRSLWYGLWDFEQTGRVTTPGGALSNFIDPITGASFAQGTGAAQPAHSLTAFNGRPAAVCDGGDTLRNAANLATLGWPTAGAFEIWALAEYTGALAAIATIFNFPTNTLNTSLSLFLAQSSTAMRVRARVGTGSANVLISDTAVDVLTGRHLIRVVSTGTTVRIDVDGNVGTPVACVASGWTGGPRNTIGGDASSTSANLFTGKINLLGFCKPLPDAYAAGLYRNLNVRKG